jgi:hypothetical protein
VFYIRSIHTVHRIVIYVVIFLVATGDRASQLQWTASYTARTHLTSRTRGRYAHVMRPTARHTARTSPRRPPPRRSPARCTPRRQGASHRSGSGSGAPQPASQPTVGITISHSCTQGGAAAQTKLCCAKPDGSNAISSGLVVQIGPHPKAKHACKSTYAIAAVDGPLHHCFVLAVNCARESLSKATLVRRALASSSYVAVAHGAGALLRRRG